LISGLELCFGFEKIGPMYFAICCTRMKLVLNMMLSKLVVGNVRLSGIHELLLLVGQKQSLDALQKQLYICG
jgi:hypothetical protein